MSLKKNMKNDEQLRGYNNNNNNLLLTHTLRIITKKVIYVKNLHSVITKNNN